MAAAERYAWREEPLEPARVLALWRGDRREAAPEAAIVGTAAIALKLTGRAATQAEAEALAAAMWRERPKRAYGTG